MDSGNSEGSEKVTDINLSELREPGLIQRTFDRLFGYDYFLAHRSVDGKQYAFELHKALSAKGSTLSCFLDIKHYGAGHELPLMQTRALKKTTRLIVICTPRAHDKGTYLLNEIREFRRLHPTTGTIVPIGSEALLSPDFLPDSPLLEILPNTKTAIWIYDSDEAIASGKPSDETIDKLLNDFGEERVSRRRMRWIQWAVGSLLLLVIASSAFGAIAYIQSKTATHERKEAITQRKLADIRAYQSSIRAIEQWVRRGDLELARNGLSKLPRKCEDGSGGTLWGAAARKPARW